MRADQKQNAATLIAFVIVSVAVTGYFVGLQAPMNPAVDAAAIRPDSRSEPFAVDGDTILATSYAELAAVTRARARPWQSRIATMESTTDRMTEFRVTPAEKMVSLARRKASRAYNGAPPTIPHPIDQRSTDACIACHEKGVKAGAFRIPRMSHQFLANCTQCHVENDPQHMPAELFRESDFVGLPAPTGGPRAYAGAPPQIPHSTWMRKDCMSCHGLAGEQGVRTTHPWRQNCQQCHAPSATMDQTLLTPEPQFLPSLDIE